MAHVPTLTLRVRQGGGGGRQSVCPRGEGCGWAPELDHFEEALELLALAPLSLQLTPRRLAKNVGCCLSFWGHATPASLHETLRPLFFSLPSLK